MSDIVDRVSKEGRNPGKPGTYLVEYEHQGGRCDVDLWAESYDDAHARMQAIRESGKIIGRLERRLPALPGIGLYVRFVCWWRNLWGRA